WLHLGGRSHCPGGTRRGMNLVVDSAGRGRSWQRLPRTLVRSFVVPTHVPRSAMDTSVTAHCHAAPAQLTREYQSDHRRYVLTPTTTRAVHRPSSPRHSLTTPFHIRSAGGNRPALVPLARGVEPTPAGCCCAGGGPDCRRAPSGQWPGRQHPP